MSDLLKTKWKSTRVGTSPLNDEECNSYLDKLENKWEVTKESEYKLHKNFKFPNFIRALEFVNKVGEFAEEKNHHPDLTLSWGKASVTIWTHRIKGLALMDFVFAANVQQIHDSFTS